MKPLFHCYFLLTVTMALSGCGQPSFELSNGKHTSLAAMKDSWVVINYWASWCKPCIEEIPQLNALSERDSIIVFGVNYDGIKGDDLALQAGNIGINYDMIVDDPSEMIKVERPAALPATVLIDRNGVSREVLYGPQTMLSITDKINELDGLL